MQVSRLPVKVILCEIFPLLPHIFKFVTTHSNSKNKLKDEKVLNVHDVFYFSKNKIRTKYRVVFSPIFLEKKKYSLRKKPRDVPFSEYILAKLDKDREKINQKYIHLYKKLSPNVIVTNILVFMEVVLTDMPRGFLITHVKSYKDMFGYFKKDKSRYCRLLFCHLKISCQRSCFNDFVLDYLYLKKLQGLEMKMSQFIRRSQRPDKKKKKELKFFYPKLNKIALDNISLLDVLFPCKWNMVDTLVLRENIKGFSWNFVNIEFLKKLDMYCAKLNCNLDQMFQRNEFPNLQFLKIVMQGVRGEKWKAMRRLNELVMENCILFNGEVFQSDTFPSLKKVTLSGCRKETFSRSWKYLWNNLKVIILFDQPVFDNFFEKNEFSQVVNLCFSGKRFIGDNWKRCNLVNLVNLEMVSCGFFRDTVFQKFEMPSLRSLRMKRMLLLNGDSWKNMKSLRFLSINCCSSFDLDKFFCSSSFPLLETLKIIPKYKVIKELYKWNPFPNLKKLFFEIYKFSKLLNNSRVIFDNQPFPISSFSISTLQEIYEFEVAMKRQNVIQIIFNFHYHKELEKLCDYYTLYCMLKNSIILGLRIEKINDVFPLKVVDTKNLRNLYISKVSCKLVNKCFFDCDYKNLERLTIIGNGDTYVLKNWNSCLERVSFLKFELCNLGKNVFTCFNRMNLKIFYIQKVNPKCIDWNVFVHLKKLRIKQCKLEGDIFFVENKFPKLSEVELIGEKNVKREIKWTGINEKILKKVLIKK